MKMTLKNFLHTFKRFKVASVLNVLGLTAAFCGFVLILIQISYELNFDKHYPEWKDIYRFRKESTLLSTGESGTMTIFTRNDADKIIENCPQIEEATLIYPYNKDLYVQVDKGQEKQGFKETIYTCYPNLPQIFGLEMIEGSQDCLHDPQNAIIPQSMAKRMFGDESAIGKSLYYNEFVQGKVSWGQNELVLNVGGVYKDLPQNVQLDNYIYSAMMDSYRKDKGDTSTNFLFYARLAKNTDLKELENFYYNHKDLFPMPDNIGRKLLADNVSDIYFSEGNNTGYKTGDKSTSSILIAIAALVIVIAGINFTNFSIALTPQRIKGINIRKVLGSTDQSLRIGLVVEAIAFSLSAFLLAMLLIYLIVSNSWLPFIETKISKDSYLEIFLFSAIVALLTGVLAGLRPAFYMTSFAPSEALKGKVVFASSGLRLRTLLVGFQFVIAIALVAATVLIYAQMLYIKSYKLGFDTDQVAIVELNANIADKQRTAYTDKMKQHPAIVDVAFSAQKLGSSDSYSHYSGMKLNGSEEGYGYNLFPVSWNFLSLMDIQVVEGRTFTEADANSGETSLIINHTLQKNSGAKIGDSFTYPWNEKNIQRVVGILGDVHIFSLKKGNYNTVFTINDKNGHHSLPISYIKIAAGANIGEVVKHINNTIASIDPAYPVKIEFYDEVFNQLYQRENKLSSSIATFSLLAIIIAVMGVFGIVVFEGESRKKEIALRKTMGSTISQILTLFNKQYIQILCISFIIAIPTVYYLIDKWMQQFAFKTPMHWWLFALGGIIVLIITVSTVSIQSYRSAINNPIDALKNE